MVLLFVWTIRFSLFCWWCIFTQRSNIWWMLLCSYVQLRSTGLTADRSWFRHSRLDW